MVEPCDPAGERPAAHTDTLFPFSRTLGNAPRILSTFRVTVEVRDNSLGQVAAAR
jgi:hypothetical protein